MALRVIERVAALIFWKTRRVEVSELQHDVPVRGDQPGVTGSAGT